MYHSVQAAIFRIIAILGFPQMMVMSANSMLQLFPVQTFWSQIILISKVSLPFAWITRLKTSFSLINLFGSDQPYRMLLVQKKNWRALRLSSCHVPSHEVMIKTTDQSWSTKRAQFQSSNPCLFNLYISMAVYHSDLFLRKSHSIIGLQYQT